jgi:hypothetical protein
MATSQLVADLLTGRRRALGGLAGIALGAASLGAVGAPAASKAPKRSTRALDFDDPKDNLYAFGKIWSGYDEPVIGAYHGLLYARIGNQRLIPLFGYCGTGANQARFDAVEGKLHLKSRETAFFTDLRTGEPMDYWDNPFTGERVEVYHFYDYALAGVLGTEIPKVDMAKKADAHTLVNEGTVFPDDEGRVAFKMPFQQIGNSDDVLLAWDYTNDYANPVDPAGWPKASVGPRVTPSEHFTFHLSKRQLEDRDVPSARFVAGFARQSNWWPWMKMGGSKYQDGILFGRMFSHKGLKGTEDVPPKILAYLEKHAPEYLEVPKEWTPRNDRLDTQRAYVQDIPPETPGYVWTQKRTDPLAKPPTGSGARVD